MVVIPLAAALCQVERQHDRLEIMLLLPQR